jgi:neutral ceramidase
VKKTGRIVLRSSVGLAALAVVLLVVCLDRVDYQPYLRAPYYTETTARLRAHRTTNAVPRGELAAGFGRALLTPTVNAPQDEPAQGRFRQLPLAGYGGRQGRPATGVHDDLYVKAVALRVADRLGVMVGADALIIPREVTELAARELAQDLKLGREQIYLSATHSHSSLGGWGEGKISEAFAGGFQPGTRTWLAGRIVSAVRQAVADLKPASFGHGSFMAPKFVRNRLVGPLGQVDPEFSYLVFKQQDGRLAVLGSFAAHATVLSSAMMEFSGDYPGCWQRAVEQATGGLAIFLAGGVGSHSPVPAEGGFKGAERMGQALAREVVERLPKTSLTNSVAFDLLGLDVTLPPLHARVSDGIRVRPWLAAPFLPVGRLSFVQAFRLDDVLWISTPCDFSGELALDLKRLLREQGRSAVITSFNGDYIGYLIPSRYYHLGGYEPSLMSFFGPGAADYFEDLLRSLVLQLAGK